MLNRFQDRSLLACTSARNMRILSSPCFLFSSAFFDSLFSSLFLVFLHRWWVGFFNTTLQIILQIGESRQKKELLLVGKGNWFVMSVIILSLGHFVQSISNYRIKNELGPCRALQRPTHQWEPCEASRGYRLSVLIYNINCYFLLVPLPNSCIVERKGSGGVCARTRVGAAVSHVHRRISR